MTPEPLYIAVIGPSRCSPQERALSREVGGLLADAGAVVVTGSLDGVSGAAADGARSRGGAVVHLGAGIERHDAGRGVLSVPTGLGELCNGLVVRAADALVCVGGGWGTLLEVALALRTEAPVVSLAGWRVRDAQDRPLAGPREAASPAEAVEAACAAAAERRAGGVPRLA